MGWLGAMFTQVFTHARTRIADVSHRDVTIVRDGKHGYTVRMTRRILRDFEKVSELRWDLLRGKTLGFRLLAETFMAGATRVCVQGGGRWKSQNRNIVPLSLYVEEPLNSKVIKSFVPEQRRRKCFSCFEILCSIFMDIWCTFHT